jgi:hypothetical protein
MFKKHINMMFSSSPAQGATDISVDGSKFTVSLNGVIGLPDERSMVKGSATLAVTGASILNNASNISASIGNNIFSWYEGGTQHSATIPDGLYGVVELNAAMSRALVLEGSNASAITISGDTATNKIILNVEPNFQLICDDTIAPGNFRGILGFDEAVLPNAPAESPVVIYGDNIAAFDRNTDYLIKTNLISEGLPVNQNNNGIIASIPLNVRPGSRIYYFPIQPIEIDANELLGMSRKTLRFELLNQNNQDVDILGESWSFVLRISYMSRAE